MARIVVALGGNALQENPKNISASAQLITCSKTAKAIVDLVENGNEIVISHGNGPQVGQIVSTYEASAHVNGCPIMPLAECGAMSQGYIGYHLQQTIRAEMLKRGISKDIVTIITQVIVDENDPAFQKPTKPVGSFYTEEEAKELIEKKGYNMQEDSGRGWRRVVPSPMPKAIVEERVVKKLLESGFIVITAGGGGIPVIENKDGSLRGIAAVIDKDLATEKIAELIDADEILILTSVEHVAINFNKPNQKNLTTITVKEAKKYIQEGHFSAGSMLPKVKAAIMFAQSKKGRKALIASLEKAKISLDGESGTTIIDEI